MNVKSYLALGSNLGDSRAYLTSAIAALQAVSEIEVTEISALYSTPAWGNTQQPDFFNCVIAVETCLEALELLRVMQRIELELHRERLEKWGPRTIDIDMIWYDDQAICVPDLIVPHPFLYQRAFVLVPLAEIDVRFQAAVERLEPTDIEAMKVIKW